MPSQKKTVKVGFDFDPDAKFKLATLKAELRRRGVPATETRILELLIGRAKPDAVARAWREEFEH
jgi:hypothetical protein